MCRIAYYLYCSTINQPINQSISISLSLSFSLSLFLSLNSSIVISFCFKSPVLTFLLVHAIQCCTQLMCSRLFRVVVECEASGASRMQVDAYAAGAPGGGPSAG